MSGPLSIALAYLLASWTYLAWIILRDRARFARAVRAGVPLYCSPAVVVLTACICVAWAPVTVTIMAFEWLSAAAAPLREDDPR